LIIHVKQIPIFQIACLVLFVGVGRAEVPEMPLRPRICINRDRRFLLGDPKAAESPEFKDSSWDAMGLPRQHHSKKSRTRHRPGCF
jgi:hypothetical protein